MSGDAWPAVRIGSGPPAPPEPVSSGDAWPPAVLGPDEPTNELPALEAGLLGPFPPVPPPPSRGQGESPPTGEPPGPSPNPRTSDGETVAGDASWGEPVWNDSATDDPPTPAVDWRKSIPREFVARSSASKLRRDPSAAGDTGERPAPPAASASAGPASPAAAGGLNGVNGNPSRRDPRTGADDGERRRARTPAGPAGSSGDADLPPPADDGPWNELDREIARALAATLAGKLSRYVTGPILPLVADELARLLGSRSAQSRQGDAPAPAEDTRPPTDNP